MRASRVQRSESWMPVLILAAALFALYLFWDILLIFIIAAFFAFVISPFVSFFDRKLPHILSIFVVYLILLIVFAGVAGLFAPTVSRQFRQFVDAIPSYIEQARDIFDSIQERYVALPARWRDVIDRALIGLQQFAINVTREAVPAIFVFFTSLVFLIFVPVLAFFMLLDYKGYKQMLIAVTPQRHRDTINDLLTCTSRNLWIFVKGELLLMTAVGALTGVGLYLIGMPYAAVFGVLAGLLELVINIGPTITTIVVVMVALLIDPILALKAGILTIVVQFLENTFLAPVVMSKAVGLDPVTVIFAIFVGGSLAGILGALIAIPIAMLVKIIILYFYVEDKDLPSGQTGVCRPSHRRSHR